MEDRTIKLIIISTFLVFIVLYFVFMLVFTNAFGNNKPVITDVEITKGIFTDTGITKCLGPFYPNYKVIYSLDTHLDEPIKECEYLLTAEGEGYYFQSNGVIGRINGDPLNGISLSSVEDHPAKFAKSGSFFNIVNNKNNVLTSLDLPTDDGNYTILGGKFKKLID